MGNKSMNDLNFYKMRYSLPVLLLCCFLNSHAQKDKTLNWVLPQSEQGAILVTKNSAQIGKYYYEQIEIVPKEAKVLHFSVSKDLTSKSADSFFTYIGSDPKFILQIKTKNKQLLNEKTKMDLFSSGKSYNISLQNTDAISVFLLDNLSTSDTSRFYFNYIISDTAALDYSNKTPQDVFNKMLEIANTGYNNLINEAGDDDVFGLTKKINYPNGLFAPMPAERIHIFGTYVTQYTAYKLKIKAPADKAYTEWNKKIIAWLKDYNVTDIKKGFESYENPNVYDEKTTYTKINAAGKRLFKVEVFKELSKIKNKETNNTAEEFYFSGVRISGNQ